MKRPILLLLITLLTACASPEEQKHAGEGMLSKEIQLRLTELQSLSDSLLIKGIEPEAIHTRFQELLLMSKDHENLQASVILTNKYLNELCAEHQFNSSALKQMNTEMTLSEISYVLKQNELNILNQILLQKMNRSVSLETAH
jgi:hypothetical protein